MFILSEGVVNGVRKLATLSWRSPEFSAKWTAGSELKRFLSGDGFIASKEGKRHVRLDPERSGIVFGQPGTGKTLLKIANVKGMVGTPDAIFVDPAGDVLEAVEKDLVCRGYEIIKLDLTDPLNSNRYSPFSYLKKGYQYDYARDVIAVCDLMMPEASDMSDTAMHFHESARNMLQSMVMAHPENFRAVLETLLINKEERTNVFSAMQRRSDNLIKQGVIAFEGAGNRERGAMDSTLSRRLRPFLDEAILEVSQGNWSFEEKFSQERPFALFIKMGLRNKLNGGPFARLVVGNALNTVRRMHDLGEKRKRPLKLFLDEARILGNCQPIVDAVTDLRKTKTTVLAAFHSLESVRETYRSSNVFLSSCAWIISGGSNDLPLYKAASDLAGEKLVKAKSVSKGDRTSETEYEARGNLVAVAEFQALKLSEVIVVSPGLLFKGPKPFTVGSRVLF